MTQASAGQDKHSWLTRNTIPVRFGSLSAGLLAALILSTGVMAYDLIRNQERIADANEGFHRLEVASLADRDFGEMRYWMTDLAVS
ncbi:MAG: hypothetical protein V2I76_01925, partial [Roseobacter sp.]|nr:hypothetical protein [Roseobacter sp.]